jgi:hypothetical protein
MVEIKINRCEIRKDGSHYPSEKMTEVELPMKCWRTSTMSGFNMGPDGKGRYCGPNQMFGGPKGGEIVLYDNVDGIPYYALITSMTQGWHSRECNLEFLCWHSDMKDRILDGIVRAANAGEITDGDVIKHASELIGFDRAVNICIKMARMRIHKFIDSL